MVRKEVMGIKLVATFFFMILVYQAVAQSDIECLKEFKNSVSDPEGALSDWDFHNSSAAICNWNGVECLHPSENKAYALSLSSRSLVGTFPQGLEKCTSLTSLDLSSNSFTGPIPSNISTVLPYLVKLDLSHNSLQGNIPGNLGNCSYLNILHLDHNQLTGSLPGEIGLLSRLSDFDVSYNKLSGEIPYTFTNRNFAYKNVPASSFAGNDLCGAPLKSCGSSKPSTGLIVGVVVGGTVALVAIAGILAWYFTKQHRQQKGQVLGDDNTWAMKIKAPRSITVSMFEKPLVKIKLSDLMGATSNFSKDSIIGSGSTGTFYKATLRDGSMLAIKRLRISLKGDQHFKSEMDGLGKVRHQNLVPLLGYCVAGPERLLIYKHMINGTLYHWLYEVDGESRLDWPTRLRIALGAARGLAWLHHSCKPRIIHRNFSPHSILLDEDFDARIIDFGISRIADTSSTHVNIISNGVFDDAGHVPPEYSRTAVSTTKGDVYSFGVVLLELVTGQKPRDVNVGNFRGNLVEWAGLLYSSNRSLDAVERTLVGAGVDDELRQFVKLACSCVVVFPKDRPSMYEIFQVLRALGEKYNLTDYDDELPVELGDGDSANSSRRNGQS